MKTKITLQTGVYKGVRASLVVHMVKKMPAMQETWVRSLGQKDPPLENGMATNFSIFAWRIPWARV